MWRTLAEGLYKNNYIYINNFNLKKLIIYDLNNFLFSMWFKQFFNFLCDLNNFFIFYVIKQFFIFKDLSIIYSLLF